MFWALFDRLIHVINNYDMDDDLYNFGRCATNRNMESLLRSLIPNVGYAPSDEIIIHVLHSLDVQDSDRKILNRMLLQFELYPSICMRDRNHNLRKLRNTSIFSTKYSTAHCIYYKHYAYGEHITKSQAHMIRKYVSGVHYSVIICMVKCIRILLREYVSIYESLQFDTSNIVIEI